MICSRDRKASELLRKAKDLQRVHTARNYLCPKSHSSTPYPISSQPILKLHTHPCLGNPNVLFLSRFPIRPSKNCSSLSWRLCYQVIYLTKYLCIWSSTYRVIRNDCRCLNNLSYTIHLKQQYMQLHRWIKKFSEFSFMMCVGQQLCISPLGARFTKMAANGSEKAFCVLTFHECRSVTIVQRQFRNQIR